MFCSALFVSSVRILHARNRNTNLYRITMPSKPRKALQAIFAHINQSESRRLTILRGQGEPGHRASPPRGGNHDTKLGGRLDFGETIIKNGKEHRRFKFQLNLNAEDATLKKLAAQNSHKVYSTADVEIKADRNKEEVKEAMEDFQNEMFGNMTD